MRRRFLRIPFGPRWLSLGVLAREAASLWRAWRDPSTPVFAKVALGAGLLYFVMPFDFAPDFMPVLGWIDDAAVLPLAIAAFYRLAGRSRAAV